MSSAALNRVTWAAAAALFLLALFLRLSLAEPRPLWNNGDAAQYLRPGAAIASGLRMYDGYPENISAARGPLFPVFLAAAGKLTSFKVADIAHAQGLLNAFCALLLFWAGAKLHSRLCGLLAAFLFAIDPVQIRLTSTPLIESFYTFILLSAAAALVYLAEKVSPRRAAVCALILGTGLLCRSALLFMPPLAALALAVLKPRAWRRSAAVILVAPYFFLLPWAARNYHHFGAPVLFEQYTSTGIMYTAAKGLDGGMTGNTIDALAAADIKGIARLSPALKDRALKEEIRRLILARPFAFLRGAARRALNYAATLRDFAGWPSLVLALAAITWNRKKTGFIFLTVLGVYFIAVHSLMSVSAHYLYPLLPLVSLFTAAGLATLYEKAEIANKQPPAAAAPGISNAFFYAAAALMGLLCAGYLAVMAVEVSTVPAGRTARFQEGLMPGLNAALAEIPGRPRAAAERCTALLASGLAASEALTAKILNDRGVAYTLAGDAPKARADFARAIAAAPLLYSSYLSLAGLELRAGSRARAAAALDQGLKAAAGAEASGAEFSCEDAAVLKLMAELGDSLAGAGGARRLSPAAAFGRSLAAGYGSCSLAP
ncbi:MAG TPA: hypothetical protein PKI19_06790 [Elusimicrobiales bacterium]|nr:hypothetical protein [Elusimicrobiales bacterium]